MKACKSFSFGFLEKLLPWSLFYMSEASCQLELWAWRFCAHACESGGRGRDAGPLLLPFILRSFRDLRAMNLFYNMLRLMVKRI